VKAGRSHGPLDLTQIDSELVNDGVKGIPGHVEDLRVSDIGAQGWNVLEGDLPFPLLTISRLRLLNNISVMQDYCDRHGVSLAPHGKTTMAPQIFNMQLAAGAWGITAASVQQLHVYRRFGVQRVLLANEVFGRANLAYLCGELRDDPDLELLLYVDSAVGVRTLMQAAKDHEVGRPLSILLDIGYLGGRTGTRSAEDGDAVVEAVRDTRGAVGLAGVAGFEGLLPIGRFQADMPTPQAEDLAFKMDGYLRSIVDTVDRFIDRGVLGPRFFVSAGGSAAFDHVVRAVAGRWAEADVILRSGCYVTHDHGMYAQTSPLSREVAGSGADMLLEPALQLWSHVLSRPEPDLAVLGFGRRDASFDYGLPVPLFFSPGEGSRSRVGAEGSQVVQLNDQHAYLRVPTDSHLAVGDRVVCGLSHPCTAFDKWRLIPVIEEDGVVSRAIRTFF
jgi:D-serine dehydratase